MSSTTINALRGGCRSAASGSLQFVPYSVVMRSKGFARTRRGEWVLPQAPRKVYVEDHALSKPGAWFRESEELDQAIKEAERAENAFYVGLSDHEWHEISLFRRGDFRSGLAWAEWCEMIDALRKPAPASAAPAKVYPRSGVPYGKLMKLWRDFNDEPHHYFSCRAEQRVAMDKLEYLISFSRDSVTLKKATRQRDAMRVIERAVTAWQMNRRVEREKEEMWNEFERMSVDSD